jgi:hypothetical protein
MAQELVVTIDGEEYRIEGSGTAEAALAGFQQLMREAAMEELTLAGGRRMVVHWGRVTAVSVREGELSYSGPAEPRWPERPF